MLELIQNTILPALPIIISLVIVESLLSIDNSLVLAAMVSHLPEKQQTWALKAGMLGAYLMRGLALAFVFFIISHPWIKLIGGAYLLYLMCSHLGVDDENEDKRIQAGFWGTVVAVELADMTFSIDNIAAAAALSDKLWVVLTGVFIGIAAMRFVAGLFVQLIKKFPVLAAVAYMLVGWVGAQLWIEYFAEVEISQGVKLGGILGIIATGLIYENVPGVSRVLSPVTGVLGTACHKVAETVEIPFRAVKHAISP